MASFIPPPTSVDNSTLQQSAAGVLSVKNAGIGFTQLASTAVRVLGTYTGDGVNAGQAVVVGFRPRLVVVVNHTNQVYFIATDLNATGGTRGFDVKNDNTVARFTNTLVDITANGFTVLDDDTANSPNVNTDVYYWMAFR